MPRPSIVLGASDDIVSRSDIIERYAKNYRMNGCMPVVHAASIDIMRGLLPFPSVMWSIAVRSGPFFDKRLDQVLMRCGVSRIYCLILDGPDPGMALEDVLADIERARSRFTVWGVSGFSAEQCARITEICVGHGITHPDIFMGRPSDDIVEWVRHHGMSMWVPDPDPMLTDHDRIIVDIDLFDNATDVWIVSVFRGLMSRIWLSKKMRSFMLLIIMGCIALTRSDNARDCDKCARECPGIFADSFCRRCIYYCRRRLRRPCIEHWYYTGCRQD